MKLFWGIVLFVCFFEGAHLQNPSCKTTQSYVKDCKFCHTNAQCNSQGGYVICTCKTGFFGNGVSCTSMAACPTPECCFSGYIWDSQLKCCVDVNECERSSDNQCVPSTTCKNGNGLYTCVASSGACGTSTCDNGTDCLKSGTTEQCGDPCLSYTSLSGPSRLSSIISSGIFPTDRKLVGWYRWTGSQGKTMQEGCIGPLKCGSAEPYTLLNGSHPSLEDGIVTRPLIWNRAKGCINSGLVYIKACPGCFYVYKYSGFLSYESFCTDPNDALCQNTTTSTTSLTTSTTPMSPTISTTKTTTPNVLVTTHCNKSVCPTIINRTQWGARSPCSCTPLKKPVSYIIIHHTEGTACSNQSTCSTQMRNMQNNHMNRNGSCDIYHNFLIGGDGNVYEGRGWSFQGDNRNKYDDKSIQISFIGSFTSYAPTKAAQNAAKSLIQCALFFGIIQSNYTLKGHRNVASTNCPGDSLYNSLKSWPRFTP